MAMAIWNGAVIAQSDRYEVLEGNVYFHEASLNRKYLRPSDTTSVCGWKGTAKYFDLIVDGEVNRNAVWYYSDPKPEAQKIRRHAAFWKGRSRGPLTLEGVGPASPRLPTKASIRHARNSAIAPRDRLPIHTAQEANAIASAR